MQRHYTLRPSRFLALLLILLCALSLVILWLLPLPTSGVMFLTAVVLCWGVYRILLDATLGLQHSCLAFRLEEGEEVVLVLRNGKHVPGKLAHDCLVTPGLIIMNMELSEQRGMRSLVILTAAMNEQSFRRLRVALRWRTRVNQAAI